MAKLLLPTASLVIKIDGKFNLPEQKNSKTATIKQLLEIIKSEPATIQYLGYDFDKPFPDNKTIEDCLMVTIHVIEDPISINYDRSASEITHHFLKHLRKNTSRILLQNSRSANGKREWLFEFYVRGVVDRAKSYRQLKQA